MISSSYIFINKFVEDNDSVTSFYNLTGCSEYPAHHQSYMEYTSLGFFVLSNSISSYIREVINKLFGKDYTTKQYMMDCLKFTYDMLEPLNVDKDKPFFELFTFGDLKREHNGKKSPRNQSWDLSYTDDSITSKTLGNDTIPSTKFADDDVIGIKTNCYNIRVMAKSQYDRRNKENYKVLCRKVQIAHTIMRLMYNDGYQIMAYALAMNMAHRVDPFYALQLAYHFRYSYNTGSSGYGDIYTINSGFCTKESFKKRFLDSTYTNSVMNHFVKDEHPLAKYMKLTSAPATSDADITKVALGIKGPATTWIMDKLSLVESKKSIDKYISDSIANCNGPMDTMKFEFKEKLFTSTCCKVPYDGILIPDSKLKRIIFKDDNESVLSVLSSSKFIQIR